MKCPRCGRDMKRVRNKANTFEYRCPICGLVIGANRKEEQRTDAEAEK